MNVAPERPERGGVESKMAKKREQVICQRKEGRKEASQRD